MKYRQCLCGQAVEERFTVCPYCKSEISAQPVQTGEPPKGPAPVSLVDRDDWYYMYEGHMVGPCSSELLQASVASGLLAAHVQIWAPGLKEWTTVGEVMQVPDATTPPPFSAAGAAGTAASMSPAAAVVAEEPVFGQELPPEEPSPFASAGPEPQAGPNPPFGESDLGNFDASPIAGEPHPWRRWFARIVDMTITAFLLGIVVGIVVPEATIFNSSLGTSILVLLVWMVAEPFVLTHFENTPGKALLNIRLKTAEGRSLRLDQAFQRSARVWFFGLGGGLPIVSLFTLVSAYNKLTKEGITSWDRVGNFSVTHGPIGVGRMVAIGLFIGCYFLINVIAAIA
ncbi:MAG: RDD family protein [Gemmatimonadota bacterium]|nr:MAG: RDD family protein [Gemmatimonadota bacterium]